MTRVVTWDPAVVDLGPAVVALGVFDGVHLGHRSLIESTCEIARADGLVSAVVTFDPDPASVIAGQTGSRLVDPAEKIDLIAALGIDLVLVVPFTEAVAALEPERFLAEVLVTALAPRTVVVGPEFRFGAGAGGDVAVLELAGRGLGFSVVVADPLLANGERVSSTRIRGLLAEGDAGEASLLLGRPHRLTGIVRRGRGQGATVLGMPTANVVVDEHAMLPGSGVYAGLVTLPDGKRLPAAVAVGRPPMFPEARDLLEAHVIGWSGDLYGRKISVEFLRRLRGQRRFDSVEKLAEAMRADAERADEIGTAELARRV